MEFPMSLSDAVATYDRLVNELSSPVPSNDETPESAIHTPLAVDHYQHLHTICHVLLQVQQQDPYALTEMQQKTVALSMQHAQAILDQLDGIVDNVNCDDDIRIRWNRPTLAIYNDFFDSDNQDDNIIDCWADQDELQEEEAILLAMASTPIPSEAGQQVPVVKISQPTKRTSECLDGQI